MDWVEFLFLEEDTYSTSQTSTAINIGLLTTAFLINLFLVIRILRIRQNWNKFPEIIHPVLYINIASTFRFFLSIMNHTVIYITEQEQSLNGFYDSCMWLLMIYFSLDLIKDSKLFYVGEKRQSFHRARIFAIYFFIILGFIILILVNFVSQFAALELLILLVLPTYALILFKTFRTEIALTDNKMVKLRFHLYSMAWLNIVLFVVTFILGFGLQEPLFGTTVLVDWYSIPLRVLFALFPLIASFMFYWSIFTPKYYKDKFQLFRAS